MPMTCIFDREIEDWDGNPFKVETPFGCAVVIAKGDLSEKLDQLREAADALLHVTYQGKPEVGLYPDLDHALNELRSAVERSG